MIDKKLEKKFLTESAKSSKEFKKHSKAMHKHLKIMNEHLQNANKGISELEEMSAVHPELRPKPVPKGSRYSN